MRTLIKIDELKEVMFKITSMVITQGKACELITKICEDRALIINGVTINEMALPIGTEVIFEGKQRFITKYDEHNKTLAYRLNGTESTELFLRTDFEEILD